VAENWPPCAELTKQRRNCKILQILFSSIALSLALTAATASTKHFGVKVIKYFAVLCINAAVTGVTISICNKFLHYMHSVTSVVSWCQKRQRFIKLATCRKQHQTVKI